jgi:hypothetical protein
MTLLIKKYIAYSVFFTFAFGTKRPTAFDVTVTMNGNHYKTFDIENP